MNSTNLSVPELHQCLQEEIIAMTSLADLLRLEELALIDGNVEELGKLTQSKSKLISHLSKLEIERKAYMEKHGYSNDAKGMQSYLEKTSSETSVAEYWKKLLVVSEKAKESNRTNGILINRQFVRNQNALNILQQNSPSESMYGANGQSTTNLASGRRIIVG
jgi:flagella synthesis protein FlgN